MKDFFQMLLTYRYLGIYAVVTALYCAIVEQQYHMAVLRFCIAYLCFRLSKEVGE